MFRYQYEADPQTMWRAEGSDTLGGSSTSWKSSGLHFGEYAAARERGESIEGHGPPSSFLGPQGDWVDRPIRMFSLRTKGRFSNEPTASHPAAEVLPQTKGVAPDEDIGDSAWASRSTGRWYRNDYEGYNSGTDLGWNVLSGYTPRRKGFLTTHKEEVLQAHAEGKDVSPAILHEAQFSPEYSETIPPAKPEAPEHPQLFRAINEYSTNPQYVTNEEYAEGVRKMKEGSSEPIWGHIGESRPAGSPR